MRVQNTAKASLRYFSVHHAFYFTLVQLQFLSLFRCGVSLNATAMIASSFLQDLIAEVLICDPNKIVRARKTVMKSAQEKASEVTEPIVRMSYDGRRDKHT